ncbi:unnamed protein product [Pichia kudriavzevii]
MIRTVPHITVAPKLSLQNCLTTGNVFQHPESRSNSNNGNGIHSIKKENRSKRSTQRRFYSTSSSNSATTSAPDFQKLTEGIPKHQLPYYNQLLSFDECLAHNSFFDPKTGDVPGGTAQFWDAVERIMPLYEDLLITGELNQRRVDELISLLRNGLRMHRFELSKLRKNVDRDLNSPLQQMQEYLKKSLVRISNDLLSQEKNGIYEKRMAISSRGLTNLFKAFTDMGLIDEATLIWNRGKKDPKLHSLFTSESVLGSVLTLLIENKEFDFSEIWSIYKTIKDHKSKNDIIHSELQVAMIRACLMKGKTDVALDIFKEITSDVLNYYQRKNMVLPVAVKNYMTMAHLSFIGYCQDYETANIFFQDSFENEMPYLTPIQINYVKKFMYNTWVNTGDFEKVTKIWIKTWDYFEKLGKSTTAISSSLNDSYLEIFFSKYSVFNDDAAIALKDLLKQYNEIKFMDEPFFNCLITKSQKWGNVNVFRSTVKVAELYNFPKTNVYHRCVLKASGSVKLPIEETFGLFRKLLQSNVQLGSRSIGNADWFAFRDATIHSKEVTNDKIDLYFKVLKLCCKHFLNARNFRLYMNLDVGLDKRYASVYEEMDRVNVDGVAIPELEWFSECGDIVRYWQDRGVSLY